MIEIPATPTFALTGKRALVTGGWSGIGLGCGAALAEAGAEVVLAARSAEKLDEAAAAFQTKGFEVDTLTLDVSDVEATAAAIAEQAPFDVLVNSAGLARHTPATATTPSDFDAVMDVNVRGAFFLTQAVAIKLIAERRPGSLVNVSSTMGQVGGIDRAVYCASKHALEGFTKAMAIEWGEHGIRVNTISPTFIRTPLSRGTLDDPERRRWITQKIKLDRIGELEDVMGAVVYLASDASALVTGTSMLIDGGWTID